MPFRFNPISKKLDLIGTATLDIRTVPATLAASTTAFTVVYNNGASGVGATLTNAGALAAFSVDGLTPAVSSRILIKNQTDETQNGIYTVTVAGDGATAWVLTRATDYDIASEIDASLVPVLSGTVNANTSWLQSNDIVTIGTTAIVYTQFTANPATFLMRANNLSDVANATTSRDNLSLGVANSPQFTNLTLTGSINSFLNVTGGQMVVGSGGPFSTFFSQMYPTSSFTRGLYLSGVVSSGTFAAQALGIDTNVSITGNVGNSNSAFITPTVSVAATFTLTKYAALQINAGNPLSGGGTLTSAYGMHIVNPGYGTNRTALYSDNGSIGYEAVTPPTNGLIVSGGVSIGASTATSLFNVGSTNQFQIGTTGIVTSGTWNAGVIGAQFGGTGVANTNTITLGGNINTAGSLTTSGAFASTFTMTGVTAVTFPTSGTLATTANTVASITGTANQVIASAATGAVTLSLPQSIATSSNVQFAQLGLGVAASNNQLSINGKASIGYSDTAAPTNGLIVAGQVGVGTSAPVGSLSNNATAWVPVTGGSGLSVNGVLFSDNNAGYVTLLRNTLNSVSSSCLGLSVANVNVTSYILSAEANSSNKFSIVSTGDVIIGSAALATTATNGFLHIPTCAGTPTGTPTTFSGTVPMIYDTTADKFWIYNGAWRGVVLT